MTYYERLGSMHLDGSQIFATPEDMAAEDEISSAVEAAWDCTLKRFGALAPVDWFAVRHDRVVGVLELKTRTHSIAEYSTVFLNVRKWLALTLAACGLGVPAIFVVRFTDGVRWCSVREVDASQIRIGGCSRVVKAANDIEPVIEVPVTLMRSLGVRA